MSGGASLLRPALFADPALRAWAVIDGAARPDLLGEIHDSGAEAACLFSGALAPEVAATAPWLVALGPTSPILAALESDWGRSQAVFLTASGALVAVRRRLRHLTLAQLPDGRTVYFRFYDPRTLRAIGPLLEPGQRAQFFGAEIAAWFCEGDDGAGLYALRRENPADRAA
jgi:hypothetical protein